MTGGTILADILERATAGAYGEHSDVIGKLAGLFMAAKFDHGWGPFICGVSGKAQGGLYEGYFICPSYGSDMQATQLYRRVQIPYAISHDDEPKVFVPIRHPE